jgi:hypothetical protein
MTVKDFYVKQRPNALISDGINPNQFAGACKSQIAGG